MFFSSLFQGFSPRSFENHRGFGAFRHQQLRVFEPGGCPGGSVTVTRCSPLGNFPVVFDSLLLRELEIWKPTDHGKYKSTPSEDVLPEITSVYSWVVRKGVPRSWLSECFDWGPEPSEHWCIIGSKKIMWVAVFQMLRGLCQITYVSKNWGDIFRRHVVVYARLSQYC